MAQHGVGYLLRCRDYGLLDTRLVRAALAGPPRRFSQADTGTVRDVYDVGWISWRSEVDGQAVTTRLIVTTRHLPAGEEPRIGKRIGDLVHELFVTDREPEALTALDVLSLYFARGGFEQTLSEEDKETDPDLWFSGHPHGQELSQILAQWVWNLRLQLGLVAAPCAPRVTLWSDAAEPDATEATTPLATPEPATDELAAHEPTVHEVPLAVELDTPEAPPLTIEPALLHVRDDFALQPDGTLRCLEGKTLRCAERRRGYLRFAARDSECRACSRSAHCLGKGASGRRGRRVDWPATGSPAAPPKPAVIAPPQLLVQRTAPTRFVPPPSPAPGPVIWEDLPATALRRLLSTQLHQQRFDWLPPPEPSPPEPLDRHRRAHRGLTWQERLARNARRPASAAPRLYLHGVPEPLAAYLGAAYG